MAKRAVIYARVSTDEQAEKGYSLQSQVDACRSYAEQHDLNVVEELRDDFSGAKLNRPKFVKLRDLIQQSQVEAVIVYSSDRWTRSLAHKLLLREELQQAGVELHYVRRGKSEDTPESRMTENIEGVFDEYWREKIIEASRRGRIAGAKMGRVVNGGKPPYGYSKSDRSLVINPIEAEIVKKIFHWYVNGEFPGRPLTFHAIARRLSETKVPTPTASYQGSIRVREKSMWNGYTVRSIIINEVYIGLLRYGKRIGNAGSGGRRAVNGQITISVPTIVDETTWQLAQERRSYNLKMSKRNTRRVYLLRGLVFCGQCGHLMTGQGSKSHSPRYRCGHHSCRHAGLEDICRQKSVRVDILDPLVWDHIVSLMMNPNEFEANLREAQQMERAGIRPMELQIENIDRAIAKCNSEASSLTSAVTQVTGIVGEHLLQKINELNTTHSALIAEREKLVQALTVVKLTNDDIVTMMNFRQDVAKGLESATADDKRQIIETLKVKVTVSHNEVQIECRLCTTSRNIDLITSQNSFPPHGCWECAPNRVG